MTRRDNSGIALILVLWILFLLMMIVTEFSFTMRQEVNATQNYRDEVDCYFYAVSGFETAVGELLKAASVKPEESGADVTAGGTLTKVLDEEALEPEWRDDQRTIELTLGRGKVEIMVGNENGKWNLNTIPEETLRALIDTLVEDEVERDTITDSILDWIDDNDLHRLNGVEDDYYESLPKPYPCKDAPFDTVEELLQVQGVTPELFYGYTMPDPSEEEGAQTTLQKGLGDMVSIYGTTSVNVNAAPKEVLISAGMTEEEASELISSRESERVPNLGEGVPQTGLPLNAGADSSGGATYSIVATGSVEGSEVRRRIKGIVRITPQDQEKYQVIYWADNYPLAENIVSVLKNLWEQ